MNAERSLLAAACERALVAGARSQRAGTRQQLRAAARRFVRRNRRDASYLRWVLRSVAASSALAVALLGLAADPAAAAGTRFTPVSGAANPFQGVAPGPTPALADLDGDGDLDLATNGNPFLYFENTGNAASPAYVQRTGSANPLGGFGTTSFHFSPVLADLDRDGDLDLLLPGPTAGVAYRYAENTGSATHPAFVERTGAQNPFALPIPCCMGNATLGDLDGDGDLDLASGFYPEFRYLENTGDATHPAFVERTGSANPVSGILGYGYFTIPALGDVDGDGDLDLVVGHYHGPLFYFENTGSTVSPQFVRRSSIGQSCPIYYYCYYYTAPALGDLDADGDIDLASSALWAYPDLLYLENRAGEVVATTGDGDPLDGEDSGGTASPAFGDLDGDGRPDLVSGNQDGTFRYFVNYSHFYLSTDLAIPNPLEGADVGSRSAPALGDLDGDGDLDLVSGEQGGPFHYFENTGNPTSPAFAERTGGANPADGLAGSHSYTKPALADLDADGVLDLVSGESGGTLLYFENTGGAASPAFLARTGPANPLDGFDVGSRSSPSLGDFDGDGDLDLIAGDATGALAYFENTGSAASPAFLPRTGAANPLDGLDVGTDSAPGLVDGDRDGDLDIVSGELGNAFLYFENAIVKPSRRSFFELPGGANPLAGQSAGTFSRPALGDLDADGDGDLVAGELDGSFAYFENTAGATSPAFSPRTGAQNPLDGQDAGVASTPALGDLDADGDLDLVAGNSDGLVLYFENTGSATSPAFTERTGAQNPLDGQDVGSSAAPALGDLDADGDLDLVAGEIDGTFTWFENTGGATSPAFVPRTGSANPLDGRDAGGHSAPALRDLDGDGDVDVVAGDATGAFHTYYLPEPAQGLLLGAGLALLKALERLRTRASSRM